MFWTGRERSIGAWTQLIAGLFGYGVAVTLMIQSRLGLGPWDAFHVGIQYVSGIAVGQVSIFVGLLIVAGTWLIGIRPGVGTIANMILIGLFIDLLLPFVPTAGGWIWGLLYFITGVLVCGLATGFYIAAGLGKGPRDGLMIGLSERTGWPVRRIRTLLELLVLAGGWLLGAPIGLGTLIFAFGIGPAVQWAIQLFGAGEPALPAALAPAQEEPSCA